MDKKEFKNLLAKAESGDAEAMYLVGLEYEAGEVVTADGEKAIEWMNKAADLGNKDAHKWLEEYYFDDDAGVQAHS